MTMNQEIIEILIGKHLDGEITPGEQRILDMELVRNPRARELLAELRELHERSSEMVASYVLAQGEAAADIFEQAWKQSQRPIRRAARRVGYIRVAVGAAAGFAIGLAVQFAMPGASLPQTNPAASNLVAMDVADPIELKAPGLPKAWPPAGEMPTDPAKNPVRNVDLYNFTDKQGNQWLVEGLREDIAQPAAYYGDL